jgi:hypothetical protein
MKRWRVDCVQALLTYVWSIRQLNTLGHRSSAQCRSCRQVATPLLVLVAVRIVDNAFDHDRLEHFPRARTLHLEPNDPLISYQQVPDVGREPR